MRQCTAAETLARVRPLLPALGITRLANITGLDRIGVEVWSCMRPNGRCLSVSLGKGVTTELAQASAVMESIELHHAERTPEPELVATARSARRRCAIVDPEALPPGIRCAAYNRNRPIGWIRGIDLASGEPVLVPHAWVDENWSRPHPDGGRFRTTSTGLAAGNHRLEAICHALFEVIERDAEWRFAQMSAPGQRAVQVNTDSIAVPMLRGLLIRLAAAGFDAAVWDMTSAVGIPAYRCVLTDPIALSGMNPCVGSGCHPSSTIALSRALTEAVQCRVGAIAGTRDDLFPYLYESARLAAPHRPHPSGGLDFATRASLPPEDSFDADVTTTLRLLRAAGFPQVAVVNLTRPEFGIPVVFAVVPGTRDFE